MQTRGSPSQLRRAAICIGATSMTTSTTEAEMTVARLLAALAAAALLPAAAQSLFTYEGADRMDRLAAAAKKEGTLTLYTTIAEKDLPAIVKPFEQKYGVKGNVGRAGTDKV